MARACVGILGIIAAFGLAPALISPNQARAQTAQAQPEQLNRTDLAPAALQQSDALIEEYARPIAEPEPTPEQKQDIDLAISLLKSQQAMKGQAAIERLLQIGPAALPDLRRLAAAPSGSDLPGNSTADTYLSTMAAIIIRRIELAQRQPILQQLLARGEAARVVLSLKLDENETAMTDAASRIDAATETLIRAAVNTTLDAPAVAAERKALADAEAAEKQQQARHYALLEIQRLLAPQPQVPPPASTESPPQPAAPPDDVLAIKPISPPTGPTTESPPPWPYAADWMWTGAGWVPAPPFIYSPFIFSPPAIVINPSPTHPAAPPKPPAPSSNH